MLIDFREVEEGARFEADLCVIGAGAAGITLARALLGAPLRVALVESGGFDYEPETQALYRGSTSGLPYPDPDLDSSRLRFFGGTTNHWNGACAAFDALDFERRDWVPHSGWPISRADLEPYHPEAARLCDTGPFLYDERLLEGRKVRDLPFRPDTLTRRFWQRSSPPSGELATRFGPVHRDALIDAPNIDVIIHANATNIQTDPAGRRVEQIELRSLDHKSGHIAARAFVLCCGGIENARLLLVSNQVHPRGLGNEHDLVGRFFMEHPAPFAALVVPTDPAAIVDSLVYTYDDIVIGIGMSEAFQAERRVLNSTATLDYRLDPRSGTEQIARLREALRRRRLPDDLGRSLWRILADVDRTAYNIYRRLAGYQTLPDEIYLRARGEQAPNPDSRVTLSRERDALGLNRVELHWQLSELDRRSIREVVTTTGVEFGRLGLGRLRLDEWLQDEDGSWPDDLRVGDDPQLVYGHMGTTRMADDPKQGVVDRDCRVHGVANLYIGGSSVFATSSFANPALTLVALALRLADHLRATLVAPPRASRI